MQTSHLKSNASLSFKMRSKMQVQFLNATFSLIFFEMKLNAKQLRAIRRKKEEGKWSKREQRGQRIVAAKREKKGLRNGKIVR